MVEKKERQRKENKTLLESSLTIKKGCCHKTDDKRKVHISLVSLGSVSENLLVHGG